MYNCPPQHYSRSFPSFSGCQDQNISASFTLWNVNNWSCLDCIRMTIFKQISGRNTVFDEFWRIHYDSQRLRHRPQKGGDKSECSRWGLSPSSLSQSGCWKAWIHIRRSRKAFQSCWMIIVHVQCTFVKLEMDVTAHVTQCFTEKLFLARSTFKSLKTWTSAIFFGRSDLQLMQFTWMPRYMANVAFIKCILVHVRYFIHNTVGNRKKNQLWMHLVYAIQYYLFSPG